MAKKSGLAAFADRTMKSARSNVGGARDRAVMARVDEAVNGKTKNKTKTKKRS